MTDSKYPPSTVVPQCVVNVNTEPPIQEANNAFFNGEEKKLLVDIINRNKDIINNQPCQFSYRHHEEFNINEDLKMRYGISQDLLGSPSPGGMLFSDLARRKKHLEEAILVNQLVKTLNQELKEQYFYFVEKINGTDIQIIVSKQNNNPFYEEGHVKTPILDNYRYDNFDYSLCNHNIILVGISISLFIVFLLPFIMPIGSVPEWLIIIIQIIILILSIGFLVHSIAHYLKDYIKQNQGIYRIKYRLPICLEKYFCFRIICIYILKSFVCQDLDDNEFNNDCHPNFIPNCNTTMVTDNNYRNKGWEKVRGYENCLIRLKSITVINIS